MQGEIILQLASPWLQALALGVCMGRSWGEVSSGQWMLARAPRTNIHSSPQTCPAAMPPSSGVLRSLSNTFDERPTVQNTISLRTQLYLFSIAAVTKCHKLHSLKQHKFMTFNSLGQKLDTVLIRLKIKVSTWLQAFLEALGRAIFLFIQIAAEFNSWWL